MPDIIINNSKAGLDFHQKLGFRNKHTVIHNGIDTSRFFFNKKFRNNFRSQYKIHKDAIVLLCVGRNDPMKDHDTLIKAFKKLSSKFPSVILLLAGLGTEKIKNLNKIITLGPRKDIEYIYSASDIIISSSAFGEGFSNVLVEGMLTNLYPVATDVGDAKKIIGSTGFILSGSDEETLKKEFSKIIKIKQVFIKTMGRKARNRAHKLFAIPKMIKSYDNVFSKVKT